MNRVRLHGGETMPMTMFRGSCGLLGVLALAGCAEPMSAEAILQLSDRDYAAARTQWSDELRTDPAASAAAQAELECQTWSDESWRAGVTTAAALAFARDPGAAAPLAALRGLDPDHYGKRRLPRPEATRELDRARVETPVLIERLLRLDALDAPERTPRERRALAEAMLFAVGASTHPAARPFLEEVATDPRRRVEERRMALVALGRQRTPEAVRSIVAAADADPKLLATSLAAVALTSTEASLAHLVRGLVHEQAAVRAASVSGLGVLVGMARRGGDPALAGRAATWLLGELERGTEDDPTRLYEAIAAADDASTWGALADHVLRSHDAALRRRAAEALSYHALQTRRAR